MEQGPVPRGGVGDEARDEGGREGDEAGEAGAGGEEGGKELLRRPQRPHGRARRSGEPRHTSPP